MRNGSAAKSANRNRFFFAQPMVGRRDDDIGMIANQTFLEFHIVGWASRDRDVEGKASQSLHDFRAIADRQLEFDVRMQASEGADRGRHEIFGCRNRADRNAAPSNSLDGLQRLNAVVHCQLDARI